MDIFSMNVWINDGWRMNEDKGKSMREKMSPISRLHFPSLKKVLRSVTIVMEERERWDPETLASGSHKTWNPENLLGLTFPVSGNWGKQWFPGLQELAMWKMAREDFPKHYADDIKIFWILLKLWLNIITNMKKIFSCTKCLWLLVIDQQFHMKASSSMTLS